MVNGDDIYYYRSKKSIVLIFRLMKTLIVQWSFLYDNPQPIIKPIFNPSSSKENNLKQLKSFDAMNNVCDIPVSQVYATCVKGDMIAILISKDEY